MHGGRRQPGSNQAGLHHPLFGFYSTHCRARHPILGDGSGHPGRESAIQTSTENRATLIFFLATQEANESGNTGP